MRVRLLLGVLVAGLAVLQTALATTVIPPTFQELVSRAQAIVRAEVVGIRCERVPYGNGSVIHTYVTLEVIKVLKGSADATIELRLLGGTVGEDTMKVEGMPDFAVGDRSVLFIENNGTQWCPLVGIMHGRYRVQRRASDGAEVVLRDNGRPLGSPTEVHLPLAHGVSTDRLVEPGGSSAMTLADFEWSIQTEIANASSQ